MVIRNTPGLRFSIMKPYDIDLQGRFVFDPNCTLHESNITMMLQPITSVTYSIEQGTMGICDKAVELLGEFGMLW